MGDRPQGSAPQLLHEGLRDSPWCLHSSHPIGEGDVVFLEASIDHCFRNTAQEPLEIICVIPKEGAR